MNTKLNNTLALRGLAAGLLLMTAGTLRTNADSVIAWGNDGFGQVSAAPLGTDFTAIAAGAASAYALRSDGSIVAWGFDGNSQVSGTPTGTNFTAITSGVSLDAYALSATMGADGSIVVWGDNSTGEISNAPSGTGFIGIAAGDGTGYALTAAGGIVAWGNNATNQVANAPTATGFTAIAGGVATGYALAANGSIAAWGDDSKGEVSKAPTGSGFTAIAAGSYTGYALTATGSIVAWGDDSLGQVSKAPSGTGFKAISAGGSTALALAANGSIVAWGDNSQNVVSQVPKGTTFTAVAAGLYNGYALSSVQPLRQDKTQVAANLQTLLPTGNRVTDDEVNTAIFWINLSVNPALWQTSDTLWVFYHDHLTIFGLTVFLDEEVAVADLLLLINEKNTPSNVVSTAQTAIERLVSIDIELANIAVQDATVAGGNPKLLKLAVNAMAKAARADQAGKPVDAIADAMQAWQYAEQAQSFSPCQYPN